MEQPTLNLQEILANLARLGNSTSTSSAAVDGNTAIPSTRGGSVPTESGATTTLEARAEDPRLRPQSRATASPKPMIDPATITTWQDGLRCVTKIAAQNAHFAASIRTMMERQRRQEMQWYTERQALKQLQANRARSVAEAQSILRSLTNGASADAEPPSNDVDAEAELASFDRKLYDSQVAMETIMTAELKALGVPFFGTSEGLVVSDGNAELLDQSFDTRPKWSPTITKSQLMKLRRRMVEHLEDLYRD